MSQAEEKPKIEGETAEEEAHEEEEKKEPEPPKIYTCACHYCDDDSIVPAQIGCLAPNFHAQALMPSGMIEDVELKQFLGNFLVIFAFPNAETTITPSELASMSENYTRFQELNVEVLGLTSENPYTLHAWTELSRSEGGIGLINMIILSDLGNCISKRYGIFDEDSGYPARATFIIDPDGNIVHISINSPTVTRSIEEIIRLCKAYQFAREHGEVCPAQWKDGEPTIKPSVSESRDFFEHRY